MNRRIFFLLLAFLLPMALSAQAFNPPQADVDEFSWLSNTLDRVVTPDSTVVVNYVLGILNKIAIGLLVFTIVVMTYESISHRTVFNIDYFARTFLFPYVVVFTVVTHWNSPIPGLGYNVHQLFTVLGSELAARIDISSIDQLSDAINSLHAQTPSPDSWSITENIGYWVIFGILGIVKGVIFAITSTAFVALAVGAIIGPIPALLYLWPPTRHWWQNWLHYMAKYTLYRVVSSIVCAVMSSLLVNYMVTMFHNNYSLEHLIALTGGTAATAVACCWNVLRVPHLTNDLAGGSAHGGSGFGAGSAAMIKGLFY
jgi:hypothetical protein